MRQKEKGRTVTTTVAPLNRYSAKPDYIRSRLKAAIVRLAVWGLVPANLAKWMIQHGGLSHV
ncbi:hypothetical protein AGMMS49545_16430 [Betaproteobacteria bacterium]|nr:hypothetical protein AGMMS49545_16430 [Betaproteobacteria bacterium]GHU46348.1 hypothetical protein AGMMS50289_19560 [Betaproteobacteria bacterium]